MFSIDETLNTLAAILERHKNERVFVLGTTCCGKTTLIKRLPGCVDMDSIAFRDMTEEEAALLAKTPWTPEVGELVDKLVYRNVHVQPGHPVFGTVIVDCEAVVYLGISDELLRRHCESRDVSFEDAKNMKKAIDEDYADHKARGGKTFYYVEMLA